MKGKDQQKKQKEIMIKNQSRCLNPKPISRQRAYLSKQKCQKNILQMKELQPPNYDQILKEQCEKFETQELMNLSSNVEEFDSLKIQKQMDHVRNLIGKLELKESRDKQSKKIKTNCSTRIDSIASPKNMENRELWSRAKTQQVETRQKKSNSVQREVLNSYGSSLIKDVKKRMIKIKSSRNVLKVYNPFPTPMAEMF